MLMEDHENVGGVQVKLPSLDGINLVISGIGTVVKTNWVSIDVPLWLPLFTVNL